MSDRSTNGSNRPLKDPKMGCVFGADFRNEDPEEAHVSLGVAGKLKKGSQAQTASTQTWDLWKMTTLGGGRWLGRKTGPGADLASNGEMRTRQEPKWIGGSATILNCKEGKFWHTSKVGMGGREPPGGPQRGQQLTPTAGVAVVPSADNGRCSSNRTHPIKDATVQQATWGH